MQQNALIHFQNLKETNHLRTLIEKKIEKLERFYPRITGCEVLVVAPNRSHHQKGLPYRVRIDVRVPGETIVVDPHHKQGTGFEYLKNAIQDSFETTSRRLHDYAEKRRKKWVAGETRHERALRHTMSQLV